MTVTVHVVLGAVAANPGMCAGDLLAVKRVEEGLAYSDVVERCLGVIEADRLSNGQPRSRKHGDVGILLEVRHESPGDIDEVEIACLEGVDPVHLWRNEHERQLVEVLFILVPVVRIADQAHIGPRRAIHRACMDPHPRETR